MDEGTNNQFHIKEFYELQGEVKTLREMFESQFRSLKEVIELNFNAINKATDKALTANDKRLEGMNEFRDTLKDQAASFITRKDFDAQHEAVKENIQRLEISRAEMDSKANQKTMDIKFVEAKSSQNKILAIAVIAVLVSIVMPLIINYFNNH